MGPSQTLVISNTLKTKENKGEVLLQEFCTKNAYNKRMKIEELTHDWNLSYQSGKVIADLPPSTSNQPKHLNELRKHKENKLKCEKQNFNYYKDGGIGKSSVENLLNIDPTKVSPSKDALRKDPLPMDYWKTNFSFIQVEPKTENSLPVIL